MKRLITFLLLLAAPLAVSAQVTPVVDFSVNNGPATYRASGVHYGILGTTPAAGFVTPIKLREVRNDYPFVVGLSQYDSSLYPRVVSQPAHPILILGDIWIGNGNPSYVDSSSMSSWLALVTSIVNGAIANGQTFEWDIWNEPDENITAGWTGTVGQFNTMWQNTVNTIRGIDPNQTIIGPSPCCNIPYVENLLTFAKANSVLPNIVAFHEFGGPAQVTADINTVKSFLATNDPSLTNNSAIAIPEMINSSETYLPGTNVQYLAAVERAQIQGAGHACWFNDCFMGSVSGSNLDGLIGTDLATFHATWYAYQAYANVTGNIVGLTPASGGGATIDGIAGTDCTNSRAYSVFGIAGSASSAAFSFTHISVGASCLIVGGKVHGKLYTLANDNGTGSSGPVLASEADYTVSGDSISIPLASMTADSVAIVQLTPASGGGGGGGGGAALVNHSAGGAGASSYTLTIPATTSGNLLVGSCVTTGTTISFTDSAYQSYVPATSVINDPIGAVNAQVLYIRQTAGGVNSVTCNSNGGKIDVYADEYSGTTLSSVVDQVASTVGASSTLMDSGFSATTTNADDVLYGLGTNYNSGSFTAGNDGQGDTYNLVDSVPFHVGSAVENFISTTSNHAYKATMTGSGASTSIMIMVAFAFSGGSGPAPGVSLSPTSLIFGNQNVGTTSSSQPITLTNIGSAALTITSISASGNFSQTNNCPVGSGSLAAASSCTITVTFTPSATGTRSGSISVVDNAAGSPHAATLTGTGVSGGGGSIRLVNHSANGANSSSYTLTIPSTTAGNFMVTGCVTTGTTIAITDSGSQTYLPASSLVTDSTAGVKAQVLFFPNTTAGITSVTCTSNGSKVDVYANEYSGLPAGSGVDQVISAVGASSTTMDSGFAPTTTNAIDLLFGLGTNYNSNTFTAGNDGRGDNYALLDAVPSHVGSADENFLSTTSVNSYKATMSGNAASTSIMLMVAFSAGGGGGGPVAPTIDFSVNNGAATFRGSGFWNGINSTTPSPALVNPTKPRLMRGTSIYTSDSGTLPRVQSFSPSSVPMFLLGDLWASQNGGYPINPCSSGCSAWSTFVTNTVTTYGSSFVYDVLNEPDNPSLFNGTEANYESAWSAAYAATRAISGAIMIAGPSTSAWDTETTDFLVYATTNNVLPNELSFHEETTPATAIADLAAAKAYLAANNPSITKIDITQFGGLSNTYLPGTVTQYLAALERAQVNDAARMCWNSDCNDNSLDGLIGTNGTTVHANWYAYQGYVNITGNVVGVTPSSSGGITVDGVAGQNASLSQAYSIFGISGGSTNVTFNFTNISSSAGYLIVGGQVHAKLYTLANDNGAGSTGPVLASEANYTVSGNAISISLSGMAADSVVIIQLTPPSGGGGGGTCASGLTCYYVDYVGGNDANNGTSEATAWKNAPGMQLCASICASTTLQPDNQVILKGGVTWPNADLTWNSPFAGTAGHNIVFTVDQTWYTGSSWTRPKMDLGGAIPNGSSDYSILELRKSYVTFDNFEWVNMLGAPSPVNTYTTLFSWYSHSDGVDGVHVQNMYVHHWINPYFSIGTGNLVSGQSQVTSYIPYSYSPPPAASWASCGTGCTTLVQELPGGYIPEGNSTPAVTSIVQTGGSWTINFTNTAGPATMNCTGCVIGIGQDNFHVNGGDPGPEVDEVFGPGNYVDDSDTAEVQINPYLDCGLTEGNNNFCVGSGTIFWRVPNIVRDNVILFEGNSVAVGGCQEWSGNLVWGLRFSTNPTAHTNGVECTHDYPVNGQTYFFGNVIAHGTNPNPNTPPGIGSIGLGAILTNPEVGDTVYEFNNVFYDVLANAPLERATTTGQQNTFNNSVGCGVFYTTPANIASCADNNVQSTDVFQNNFFSTSNATVIPNSPIIHTNLTHTEAQWNALGYNTTAETYAYAPPTATSPTVAQGTSIATLCSGIVLPSAQTACLSDTPYAVSYNTSNHTVVIPARTTVTRPSTPDVGAYQFIAGPPPQQTLHPHVITGYLRPEDVLHGVYASMWQQGE